MIAAEASERSVLGADASSVSSADDRVARIVDACLKLLAAATFAGSALIAVVHIADRFNVNHVSGTWMGLAQDVHDGIFYRPLYEDGIFGGTWYMPLTFVLHGGISFVTGDLIVSGKLLTYASAAALLALAFVALRRVGCPRPLAAALVAAVLLSPAGLFDMTSVRGDVLPVTLQVAALVLVARASSRRTLGAAGALCALAVVAKLSALFAPAAIFLWLFAERRRRESLQFAGIFAGGIVVLVGLFELLSGGQMISTLRAVATSGESGSSVTGGITRFIDALTGHAGPIWLLLPFAALAVALAIANRRLSIFQIAFLVEIPIVVVVLADPGADFNHLIDLAVLTVLVVGELAARSSRRELTPSLALAISCALLLAGVDAARGSFRVETTEAARILVGSRPNPYPTQPLRGYVAHGDSILSEDPSIPLLLDEQPVLLDGVSVRRIGLTHPAYLADLSRRIGSGAFDEIVLLHPVTDAGWYDENSLGAPVRDAIRRSYRLLARVPGDPLSYWVYEPRAAVSG